MERMPVKVGVGVLVWKGDKVALVKRSGSYGLGHGLRRAVMSSLANPPLKPHDAKRWKR